MSLVVDYNPVCTRRQFELPDRDGFVPLGLTVGNIQDIFALLDAYRTLMFSGKRCPADYKFPEMSFILSLQNDINQAIKRSNEIIAADPNRTNPAPIAEGPATAQP